jgi:exodeoxyribonuclease-3
MRLYSWNVNGFRAVARKGFWDWFNRMEGDVVCLQETKVEPAQLHSEELPPADYGSLWHPAEVKRGYSGVAVFYRVSPGDYRLGLPDKRMQGEGRLIQMEFDAFHLFNVYFPNGQMGEERLQFKLEFYDRFLEYIEEVRRSKPIVVCGDFNTAHREIDLKNPQANANRSGFLPIERDWLDRLTEHGYEDTFRLFTTEGGHYTWWDYRTNARARNAGWRIDYFFVSRELRGAVKNAWIEPEVYGSDHCPVGLELDL